MQAIYFDLCPICKKELTLNEIKRRVCNRKCLPLCYRKEDSLVEEFQSFFEKIVGKPKSIQIFWAKRILRNESFAAIAPTGIGKTSFGLAMALFLATKWKRSYVILPTTILVRQSIEILQRYVGKLNIEAGFNEESDLQILYYHGNLKKKEKEKFFEELGKNRYKILITTTQFLSKHFQQLKTFNFIFVDDVDAILKASRNVDRILMLLGFRQKGKEWVGEAKGCLMVSTATGKKGRKTKLFRELLSFDVGSSTFAVRNITDIIVKSLSELEKILRQMGKGGIIYATSSEEAEKIYERLKNKFRIGIVTAEKKKDYERFEKGELDYLVGTAYYYGTLVRGLDLPEKIRFTVFYKCPVFRIRIEDIDSISENLVRILALIFRDDERVKKFVPILPSIERRPKELEELRKILKEVIKEGKIKEADVVVREGEIIIPDVRTYIQGSGRCSRLFAGGITKGASFILEEDEEILEAFIKRASFYDIEFIRIEDVNFSSLIKEIDETRKSFGRKEEFDIIKPTLFIVESPTKAKQISRFFGKPSIKIIDNENEMAIVYEVATGKHILLVTASLGHVTDLITNRGYHGVLIGDEFIPIYASIKKCKECGYQFTEEVEKCPKCGSESVDNSKKRINALRKLAHDCELIIIGTDPDTEGEKIAWDLRNLLAGCGEIKRAEFHEVTKKALTNALENLRDIDENLVKAQIVRRIEDRWIGFELSQKLWKVFNDTNLSAGRAQTPVLGWIMERAKEHRKKRKVAIIKELGLTLEYDKPIVDIEIELIEEREEERSPLPPYTTDTMLRDANNILKLKAEEAMKLAQALFENGLITYHRTDSTKVSDVGLRIAEEYLGSYFSPRKGFGEGAHECIRPTRAIDKRTLQRLLQEGVIQTEELTLRHLALYDLIFRRFMASQCKKYKVKVAKYKIKFDGKEIEEERILEAEGKAIELYKWCVSIKKPLPEGKRRVKAEVRALPLVPLYSQADVLQLMKERGIGRPSTYATLLQKLFLREYIRERYGKLVPTFRGIRVFNFLSRRYSKFVSEERTRLLEEKMDKIEQGKLNFEETLKELYQEVKSIR